jgi:DNA-binding MarR family transcriptional regulator
VSAAGPRAGGLDNAIGFWIHRVYQASRDEMYRRFREVGEDVTPEQWAVLIRLWERDGQSQSELLDATFRDAPTMSRILAVMEERGYLERHVDSTDARVRLVRLTRRGRDVKKKLVPVAESIVKRMVTGIEEDELVRVRAHLRRMFENIAV